MRLNHYLGELVSDLVSYGEHLFWFAVMGEPSKTAPWGWQLEGHHLIINFFVVGDQIVTTPTFMGSEPVSAKSGKYAGVEELQDEQNAGLALMRSLSPQQQTRARIGKKGGFSENVTEAYMDNLALPFEGLAAREMSPQQRNSLLNLIGLYAANIREPHERVKMSEVGKHLDRTHFAWKDGSDPDSVFYYRIHSPVILIEFDHAGTIALDGPRGVPLRRHIHTVVRTPMGTITGRICCDSTTKAARMTTSTAIPNSSETHRSRIDPGFESSCRHNVPLTSDRFGFSSPVVLRGETSVEINFDCCRWSEVRNDTLPCPDRQHAGHRSSTDCLARAQSIAEPAALLRKPQERAQRIAHDVGASAAPPLPTVDLEPNLDVRKPSPPLGNGATEHVAPGRTAIGENCLKRRQPARGKPTLGDLDTGVHGCNGLDDIFHFPGLVSSG